MNLGRFSAIWVALLSILCVAWPQSAPAAPSDEHWSPQFGQPGTPNLATVQTIAWNRGRLYASGLTTGLTTNCPLMVFDGNQWSKFADFNGSLVQILSMAFVGDDLYVGGIFNSVNGVPARSLARWNGNSWSDLNLNGIAFGLAANGTDLYVAGNFTNSSSVIMTNIGRWDGSAWHPLGDGLGRPGAATRGIAFANGNVYVGGQFTNSGAVAVTNLAVWNGSTWSAVGGGVIGTSVSTLAWQGNDLYAGGTFTLAGGTPASNIARWDGNTWSALGTGLSGTANTFSFLNGILCVGGNFTSAGGVAATNFATWDGVSWAGAGGGLSSLAACSAATGTNVFLGGSFFAANGGIANNVAAWDGERLGPVGAPGQLQGLNSTVRAIAHDGSQLYAAGLFSFAGSTNAVRVARFNGTNWSNFGGGLNASVRALALVGTNLYAGGDFTGGTGGPGTSHLARWNGANWVPLTNFNSTVVNALAARGNDLFIAGYFNASAADGTAIWLTRWDGTNLWKVLVFEQNTFNQFQIDNIGFTAMAVQGQNVYVSGRCSVTPCDANFENCTNSQNVMWFDGTYARGLGTGLSSNANAIIVMGTDVYFGGPFTNAGGSTARGIARWDGANWWSVGGGIVGNGSISAMAVLGTNLYAGGSFTNIGGVPVNCIARWNGSTWSALGSGTRFSSPFTTTTGPVFALNAVGDDLYVGGTFQLVGGKSSYFLARWNENLNFDPVTLRLSQPAATPGGTFQFTLTTTGVPLYVLETSTDLINWNPVLTNSITPYDYAEPNTLANPRRFFRARSLP